jgi:hypothetical protein
MNKEKEAGEILSKEKDRANLIASRLSLLMITNGVMARYQ